MTKAELRKIYLARQRNLSHSEHLEKSRQIAADFFRMFDLKNVRFLHGFLPIEKNREVDTWLVFQKIWRDFPYITTVTSIIDFEKIVLESVAFSAGTKLVFNKWGILEPSGGAPIEPGKIDVVLTPLLAFDERGFRVGYGKGYYDKFFSHCRADVLKIGLSYFPPIEEISDVHELDVKLDFCITPEEIFSFDENPAIKKSG
jgi:5-formyltetrahydrofolate cyclo-ligase